MSHHRAPLANELFGVLIGREWFDGIEASIYRRLAAATIGEMLLGPNNYLNFLIKMHR